MRMYQATVVISPCPAVAATPSRHLDTRPEKFLKTLLGHPRFSPSATVSYGSPGPKHGWIWLRAAFGKYYPIRQSSIEHQVFNSQKLGPRPVKRLQLKFCVSKSYPMQTAMTGDIAWYCREPRFNTCSIHAVVCLAVFSSPH